jgi:exopolyphosphatase / guanosine-5'-triphosphate,3'-diphosphate pyrophosphatase
VLANAVPARPADTLATIRCVRVAVIDVGSNSVRLLVAAVEPSGEAHEIERDRVYLRLGDDAYHFGHIGARKLDELEFVAERFALRARTVGVERLETIVTAPGRQASNTDELVDVLADATRAPVVVLSAKDEARLAWEGAVAALESQPDTVAVADLGGGSCEVAFGRRGVGPTWVRSCDAGALRITRSFLSRPRPTRMDLETARAGVRDLLVEMQPPRPDAALAVGGTARAVGRIVGARFGARKLDALADRLGGEGHESVGAGVDVTAARLETLLGGTLVLAELARRLDTKLEVGGGGLREGAARALARLESAAA